MRLVFFLSFLFYFFIPFSSLTHAKKLSPSKAWRQQTNAFRDKYDEFKEAKEIAMKKYRDQLRENRNFYDTKKKDTELKENNEITQYQKEKEKELSGLFTKVQSDPKAMMVKMQTLQFSKSLATSLIKNKYKKIRLGFDKEKLEKDLALSKTLVDKLDALAKEKGVVTYPYPDLSKVPEPSEKRARRHKKQVKKVYKS